VESNTGSCGVKVSFISGKQLPHLRGMKFPQIASDAEHIPVINCGLYARVQWQVVDSKYLTDMPGSDDAIGLFPRLGGDLPDFEKWLQRVTFNFKTTEAALGWEL
jgi:hypothetical protein